MIRSVSMLSPGSGSPLPSMRRMRSMGTDGLPHANLPHVHHFARDRRGRDHRRAHEQRAARRAALAPLEVAIRRGGADLAAFETILVHRQTHRAAGAAPVESRRGEDTVETFTLCRGAN